VIISVPTENTDLLTLIGGDRFCTEIFLQALDTNAAVVNFGPNDSVDHFLIAGQNANVPLNDLSNYSIRGSSGDKLVISIYRR
jgi:hypothetical protein